MPKRRQRPGIGATACTTSCTAGTSCATPTCAAKLTAARPGWIARRSRTARPRGSEAIRTPGLAPGSDGGHVDMEGLGRSLGRGAAVAARAPRAPGWPFWAAAGNPVDRADPLALVRRKGPAPAVPPAFRVQLLG